MQIIINLMIFLITLFLYIHINFQCRTNNDLEIFDIDNITKDQLEEVCNYKQPILFKFYMDDLNNNLKLEDILAKYRTFDVNIRNISESTNNNLPDNDATILPLQLKEAETLIYKDTSGAYISEYNKDFIEDTTLKRHFESSDIFLRPHLCSECQYDIIFGSKDSYTPLRYELNARNFIYVVDGSVEIMLTIPNNSKYLDVVKDYELFEFRSRYNPFNQTHVEQLERAKFLTVTLSPGDILFIPFKWFYTIKFSSSKTVVATLKYRVVMNTLAIIPDLGYRFLERQNIKFNFLNTIS